MATGEFSSLGNPVLLIGVGGLGCELAARCSGAPTRRLLNFDADALAAFPSSEAVCLPGEAENTADMDTDEMLHPAEEAAREIIESTQVANGVALFLCSVGSHTASIVVPTLVSEFKAAQCTVVVVAVEPMPFEGADRAEMAARAIAELENVADLVLLVPNRPLADFCDAAVPVAQAIARLKDKAVQGVEQLLRALACASCIGLQPLDLRRSLAEAGRGAFGIGAGAGDGRIPKAIRDACANSFLTPESCQHASAAILHLLGSRDLSLREVHEATDIVGQLVGRVPIQVGLTLDPAAGDSIRATLLVTGVHRLQLKDPADDAPVLPRSQDLSYYDGVDLDVPAFLRRRAVPQLRY
jgi:cell division protein FtsZ